MFTHAFKRVVLSSQGTDFCGNQGFDTLVKRLKDGKKMCTDFEEFIEKR